MNLHDEVNDVLPTVDEYDKFYSLHNDGVDYDDDTKEKMHEDDTVLDSDITLENGSRGDDNEVNATFEIPIALSYDLFVSAGCGTGDVPIATIVEDRHKHDLIRNESDPQITRARTSQIVSRPSTSVNELSPSNDCSLYSNDEIETGYIRTRKSCNKCWLCMQ